MLPETRHTRETRSGSKPWLRAARLLVGAAAFALWIAVSPDLHAQEAGPTGGSVSVDARGGLVIPVDQLDVITQTGASFGGGVAFHVTDRLALRGDVEYRMLSGDSDSEGTEFADMTSLAATGGIEVHFVSPETRWTGSVSFGAGISTLETDPLLDDGSDPPAAADLTGVGFRGGTKLGYRATERVTLYLEPAVYLSVFNRPDTQGLADASPDVQTFDTTWDIPVQAGVRVDF